MGTLRDVGSPGRVVEWGVVYSVPSDGPTEMCGSVETLFYGYILA